MAKTKNTKAPKDAKSILIKIGVIAFIVAFVAVLAFSALRFTTGIIHRSSNAVKIGDKSVTAMDLRILTTETRANYLYSYGYILEMYGYDLSTIDSQTCLMDSSMSWGDYFVNEAVNQAANSLYLVQMAEKNGYKMSDEVKAEVADYIDAIKENASENGVSIRKYLKSIYGVGTTLKDVEKIVSLTHYANDYYKNVYEGFYDGNTADEVEAYYSEHKDEFDVISYYSLSVPYTVYKYTAPAEGEEVPEGQPESADEATSMTEASKADAKAKAEAILEEITDKDNFDEVAAKYWAELNPDSEEAFETAEATGAIDDEETVIGKWYNGEGIEAGAKAVLEDEEAKEFLVVLYAERIREEKKTVDVRHILISAEEAAEDATDAEKAEAEAKIAEAKAEAEALLAEWKAGEATEDSFAKLAVKNTDDTGSVATGGLYETVVPGDMVEEFDAWIFDEARKSGDVEIVKTEFGYHIIYFVDHGPLQYEDTIRNTLAGQKYETFFKEQTKDMTLKTVKFGTVLAY